MHLKLKFNKLIIQGTRGWHGSLLTSHVIHKGKCREINIKYNNTLETRVMGCVVVSWGDEKIGA